MNQLNDEKRSAPPSWSRFLTRIQNIRWSAAITGTAVVLTLVLIAVIFLAFARGGESSPGTASGPQAPSGSPIDSNSSRPPDDPALAPNQDPAAQSAFGIEAQKLLDELRGHSVPFTDADANILVDIGDKNVARNDPDLTAEDPQIADQVARAFPQYNEQQRADTVRCLAEYVEQTLAKNQGTTPPDGQDHN